VLVHWVVSYVPGKQAAVQLLQTLSVLVVHGVLSYVPLLQTALQLMHESCVALHVWPLNFPAGHTLVAQSIGASYPPGQYLPAGQSLEHVVVKLPLPHATIL